MVQAVIFIVLASIIFNWLYKKDHMAKKIINHLLQLAVFVTSIVGLSLGGLSLVMIIYLSTMISILSFFHIVNTFFEYFSFFCKNYIIVI